MTDFPYLSDSKEGALLRVYLAPRASRNEIVGRHGDSLKIALTAPPVDGKANQALIAFLAAAIGIPKRGILIVKGELSRNKVVRFESLKVNELSEVLRALLKARDKI